MLCVIENIFLLFDKSSWSGTGYIFFKQVKEPIDGYSNNVNV